ncbi:sensor histidine kinase [Litoreibacter roseus]|uniref:histidine kinase n=1 Tax=Litoreibacter roseus TaxID=2601869 RepID=A0A6N6JIM0_9RHOB|nr:sensor histidine kinase [Litoreibacter roseus]GFE66116.1 histidine kinase [Litoreibacter roseus]
MTPKLQKPLWYRRIGFQVAFMMSLALLPLGLIAVGQSHRASVQVLDNAEQALLALTSQAAYQERLVIQRAVGAAAALGDVAGIDEQDPRTCADRLDRYIETQENYIFVGVTTPIGVTSCASSGAQLDLSEQETFKDLLKDPKTHIWSGADATGDGTPLIVVSEPFYRNNSFGGFVSIYIPPKALTPERDKVQFNTLNTVITFDTAGRILTSTGQYEDASDRLPQARSLETLSAGGPRAFVGTTQAGQERIFTVAPIVEKSIYVLGVWQAPPGVLKTGSLLTTASLFPIVMWLTSLAVALFAVHRLIIRHIVTLGGQMRRFARDRALPGSQEKKEMPAEILVMQENFTEMAYGILEDEARLVDAVREKNIYLKEVHHRVKNNLQLISSILNMQIRKVSEPDVRMMLKRLQERVLNLATIHRNLYQADSAGAIDAADLIREVVANVTANMPMTGPGAPSISVDAQNGVSFYPDQAVPFSLLLAEILTNALTYASTDGDAGPWAKISFEAAKSGKCKLAVKNSVSKDIHETDAGIGAQLIRAFVIQLDAQEKIESKDGVYEVAISFDLIDNSPPDVDF